MVLAKGIQWQPGNQLPIGIKYKRAMHRQTVQKLKYKNKH